MTLKYSKSIYNGRFVDKQLLTGNSVVTQTECTPNLESNTVRLTKSFVESQKYKKGRKSQKQQIHWDISLPGFGLRVYPSNRKTFVIKYRHHGRQHLMVIGNADVINIEEARDRAKKFFVNLIDQINPLEAKEKSIQGQLFKDLAEAYIERHAKLKKRTWHTDLRRLEIHVLPRWANIKVKSIKRMDVAALHHIIGRTAPYEANRTKEVLSKMFSLATFWGFLDENAYNPAKGIQDFPEKERDRYVEEDEMPRLIMAINQESNIYIRHIFWMYLFTGLRRRELLGIKWSDINWDREELRIDKTKNGRPHYVPLSVEAMDILKKTPKKRNNPYVFVGDIEGNHFVNVDRPWDRIQKAANLYDVRIHDLRRTVGSYLAQSGHSLPLIGKVLNQTTQRATQVYARFANRDVKQALYLHGQKMTSLIPTPPKKICKLKSNSAKRRNSRNSQNRKKVKK